MTTVNELDQPATDKELNFARLRDKLERVEQEKQDLELALKHKARATQSDFSSSLLKEAGINQDEPYVETSKLADLMSVVAKHNEEKTQQIVSQALSDYQSKNMFTYMQAETGGQFSKVVNEEALKKLQEDEPEVMIAMTALEKDPAAKASFLFKKCLRIKEQEESLKKAKERMNNSVRMHGDYQPTAQSPSYSFADDQDNILNQLAPRGSAENAEQIRKILSAMPRPRNTSIQ